MPPISFFSLEISRSYGGAGDDNLITLATFAQEENLEQQLQWGSRVLDIRIGYCKSCGHFGAIILL